MSTCTWTGQSGQIYHFNIHAYGPPKGAGVYIYAKNEGTTYYPQYIGQTDDVQRRHGEHMSTNTCIKNSGWTSVNFLPISSEAERFKVETDLRHNYHTTCNLQ